jgi:acetyl esterase/lipase
MVLHYGVYDLGGTPSTMTAGKGSLVLHGPTLERQVARLCPGLTREDRRQPDLSPLHGDLTGLPPALIVVGDIDPLRDDSVQLAERLQAAGVEAELALLPEAPHGIIHFPGAYAAKVRARGHRWLRQRLAANPA